VGAEGGAPGRVVVAQGVPETDPTLMQRIVKGERTEPLASRHPADQALVASEERCLRVTDLLAGARGALGRLGHSNTSCGRTCLVPGPLGGIVMSSSAHPLGLVGPSAWG